MKFETIKELHDAVKSGKVNESDLTIILDNDCTSFLIRGNDTEVLEADGYSDIEHLYLLLFPKATVEWC